MTAQNKTTVKGYFETGDVPTEAQFIDLIDSYQDVNARLTNVSGLAVTDGGFIVGDGSSFVIEAGATARDSLGLGSIATQASGSVTITGGSISGITDLAVADGGTGASTASAARTNLAAVGTDPTGITGADAITNVVSLTQAEYDAIGSPDAATLYVITDAA